MVDRINNSFKKSIEFFKAYGGEETRNTFRGELNYESGKLFFMIFIAMVAWLPYIPSDKNLHQFPIFAIAVRLGINLLCIVLLALRFTKYFRERPGILLMILMAYLYFGSSLLTASSGHYASSYIGGFAFVTMLPAFAPFPFKFKLTIAVIAVSLFYGVGILMGLDFSDFMVDYAVINIFSSTVISILLSYANNKYRYITWEQRQKLKKRIIRNEKSLATMLNFADKAEMTSKAKSEFLTTMSHEIRTPMNAILGVSEIQMQRSDIDSESWKIFDKIHNSGQTLLGIINDILDLSKIETGKLELNPTQYDVPSFINDTVQFNVVRIGSKPIEFKLDISGDFPRKLIGDEIRLKQVLNNLLSNAFKYTEKGVVMLSANSTKTAEGEVTLCFKVSDTGQGMKPEDVKQLFDRYSRFDFETNRNTERMGIGLNITKSLVTMMGGDIQVESTYGKGSIFTVKVVQDCVDNNVIGTVLAKKLCEFSYSHNDHSEQLQINREYMPYGSVLVVDDVETNLYVAKGFLLPYGLKIETASSGFEAIDKIKGEGIYDIVFMDHMMPEMNGIEATHKLRDMGYKGVIVALTANAVTSNDVMFKQNGFDDFISKPIDAKQLDVSLNKYIRNRNPEEALKYKNIEYQAEQKTSNLDQKLIQIFCIEEEKALLTLRDAIEGGDTSLFTITVHGMKSALLSIGELELSKKALHLEQAGSENNMEYILENTESFSEALEELIKTLKSTESEVELDMELEEDNEYLIEQLRIIELACYDLDLNTVNTTLELLKEKKYKKEIQEELESISEMLLLHNDFEGVAEKAIEISEKL